MEVTTEGWAFGLEKGSHTSRSHWAHQVTVAALSIGFLTGHMGNIIPSHKTMRNSTLRSGANIWHQQISSLITGTPCCNCNFYSCSSLDHNVSKVHELCRGAWKNSSMDVCPLPLFLIDDCSCQRPTTPRDYQLYHIF